MTFSRCSLRCCLAGRLEATLPTQGERSSRARRTEGTSDAARLLTNNHGKAGAAASAALLLLLLQVAAPTVAGEDLGTAGRPRQSVAQSVREGCHWSK